ncbi:MAG: hypothetical protein RMK91_09525 [Pseudanabaenaceae cyanobacterium SKYGB_i_bin29]|nr:hypothetical protein [Pseudanabaenaceae cyanobacterium SKYG29]MDW8422094.1 hypothetical protein [Pseudanabaenaceae cyanobacterium SKYGB_i_bin29]
MGALLCRLISGVLLSLGVFLWAYPVGATVPVKLSDLSYRPCPPGTAENIVLFGGTMAAKCYLISGTATNSSGKVVYNADVFGRIYDANGNDVIPERGRIGSIAEIPVGKSRFEIMVSVPAEQPEPLELKQFKASGFTGRVRR